MMENLSTPIPGPQPQVSIIIAVDTAFATAQSTMGMSGGIYMMDNMAAYGSTGEGQTVLNSVVPLGTFVGFQVVPIDPLRGDTVVITELVTSAGNVFGPDGGPVQVPSVGGQPEGSYWIGRTFNPGTQVYQIQIQVTVGQGWQNVYFGQWAAIITATL